MICEKLKFEITVYHVTNMHRLISNSNIVSTKLQHEIKNKQKDRDAFDLQNIQRVGQSFFIF